VEKPDFVHYQGPAEPALVELSNPSGRRLITEWRLKREVPTLSYRGRRPPKLRFGKCGMPVVEKEMM
jgi:hypothetical protein